MDMKRKLEDLTKWMEGKEKRINRGIGGKDFNARSGREGGRIREENEREEEEERNSMDRKINKDGSKLVEFIREREFIRDGQF